MIVSIELTRTQNLGRSIESFLVVVKRKIRNMQVTIELSKLTS
jgi:hypothetical protein